MRTAGYGNPQGGFGEHLNLIYSVLTYGPIFSFYIFEFINIGIGPSLNLIEFHSDDYNPEKSRIKKKTTGLTTHLRAHFKFKESFSANLIFQYRNVGNIEVGPYQKKNTVGYATPNPTTVMITFPETKIDYDHYFIGIGIGMHI